MQSLDKLAKIGEDGVKKELNQKGLTDAQVTSIFDSIKLAQPDEQLLQVFSLIESFGVPKTAYKFEPTLVRGPDYYTGTIFETIVDEPKIGAIGGGGRYDKLINSLGGPDIPAVGYSFGFERIIDCITELNLFPEPNKTTTKILVANFSAETEKNAIELTTKLRDNNISTTFYPLADKLGKQFKYADNINVPYVAVLGPDEISTNKIMIKNMTTGEQELVSFEELVSLLKLKQI